MSQRAALPPPSLSTPLFLSPSKHVKGPTIFWAFFAGGHKHRAKYYFVYCDYYYNRTIIMHSHCTAYLLNWLCHKECNKSSESTITSGKRNTCILLDIDIKYVFVFYVKIVKIKILIITSQYPDEMPNTHKGVWATLFCHQSSNNQQTRQKRDFFFFLFFLPSSSRRWRRESSSDGSLSGSDSSVCLHIPRRCWTWVSCSRLGCHYIPKMSESLYI